MATESQSLPQEQILCPNNAGGAAVDNPATLDHEGFCSAHGWDCADYGEYLSAAATGRSQD